MTEPTIKSIELALENELKERDFYVELSEKAVNPVGKKMFETIGKEEEEHYQHLKEIQAQVAEQGNWPESVPALIGGTHVKDALNEIVATAENIDVATADDKEAIQIAIEFEQKAYNFYVELKNQIGTKVEKDFFGKLASIEHEHVVSLKDTLQFFEDPKAWYEELEKPNFEA